MGEIRTLQTDVLVVGSGQAGSFAACAAAEAGAKTLLIEKAKVCWGPRSSAFGAVGSRYQKAAGVEIDVQDLLNDVVRYSNNHANARLWKKWADNSADCVNWYGDIVEAAGLYIENEYNTPPEPTRYKYWPTGHGTVFELDAYPQKDDFFRMFPVLAKIMVDYLEEHGGAFMPQTKMEDLIKEDGKVVGVCATDADGNEVRIHASKGVIVATGGYGGNEEMMEKYQGSAFRRLSTAILQTNSTGDGINAMMRAGAQLEDVATMMAFDRGVLPPDGEMGQPYDNPNTMINFGSQPFLKVNCNGQRFCNESSPYMYVFWAARPYGDGAWYPIWDSNWKTDVDRFHTMGCSTLIKREGGSHDLAEMRTMEQQEAVIENAVADGKIIKADTIEELASGLLLPVDELRKTVERYNEIYDAQEDADFGKEPFRLSSLRTPPFYGMKLGGACLCTLHGVVTDDDCRVIDADGNPIEGLYSVGNDQGGFYAGVYPSVCAGLNAGRAGTLGWLVGRELAQKD